MASYQVGALVRLKAEFRNDDGDHINPTAVRLQVQNPAGIEADKTPVHDSLGHYSFDLDVETAGQWVYRWSSTGTGQAANEASFFVKESEF